MSSGSRHRAHLMPIAVGMYLPFGLATPILIGGLIAHLHSRTKPADQHDQILHRGILFSSGVIAGEALTAVGIAGLAAAGASGLKPDLSTPQTLAISIVVALAVVVCFSLFTRPAQKLGRKGDST